MTQRFGRNKRRAAREAVEKAQAEVAMAERVVVEIGARRRDAEALANHYRSQIDQVCENLIRAFGRNTAFLPIDRSQEVSFAPGHYIHRWPVSPRLVATMPVATDAVPMNMGVMSVNLIRIIAELDRSVDSARLAIRVKETSETGSFETRALNLSREALLMRHGKLAKDEVAYILRDIIKQLQQALTE